jgi:hypothetical protein
MSSRKLQAIVKTQYNFINNLLDRLEGKTKSNDTETEKTYKIGNKKYSWYEIITLLGDNYFNGLNLEQIFELAKKSIRITTENRRLEDKLENIKFKIKDLKNDLCDNCGWRITDNCEPNGYVCGDLFEMLSIIEDKEDEKD